MLQQRKLPETGLHRKTFGTKKKLTNVKLTIHQILTAATRSI